MGNVDPDVLIRLLSEGKTKTECAKYFEVSRPAISKWVKRLASRIESVGLGNLVKDNGGRKPVPIKQATVEILEDNEVNTLQQFRKINEKANSMLDAAMACVEKLDLDDFNKEDVVRAARLLDSTKDSALRSMAEIRQQIKLQLEMFEIIYGIKAREEARNIILEEIGKESEDVQQRIYTRLSNKGRVLGAIS